jgi:hypothetical protein
MRDRRSNKAMLKVTCQTDCAGVASETMAGRIGNTVRPKTDRGTTPSAGRARSLANLRRGGSPGRKRGIPNAATLEIRALASRLLMRYRFVPHVW